MIPRIPSQRNVKTAQLDGGDTVEGHMWKGKWHMGVGMGKWHVRVGKGKWHVGVGKGKWHVGVEKGKGDMKK